MELHYKTIDITKKDGWKKAIELQKDSDWTLISGSFLGIKMLFEKKVIKND